MSQFVNTEPQSSISASINEEIARSDKLLLLPDSLHHIKFEVSYRGKNKMGPIILNKNNLFYFPAENKIQQVNYEQ